MDDNAGSIFLHCVLLADKAAGNDWKYRYTTISPRILLDSLSNSLHSLAYHNFRFNRSLLGCNVWLYRSFTERRSQIDLLGFFKRLQNCRMDVETEPKDLSKESFGIDESLATLDRRDTPLGHRKLFKDESVLARFGKRQELRVSP